jgi:hypothetical protein
MMQNISSLWKGNLERGFSSFEEGVSVAYAAFDLLLRNYKISVEFDSSSIDCSTLTSQSYWLVEQSAYRLLLKIN